MTKIQMTKTKTNARETCEKHERVDSRILLLFFVLNFENLNLNSLKGCPRRGLSNFALRASDFLFMFQDSGS
jgi:hypothetical protein